MLQCDKFDISFKNLIGDALDTWRKTNSARYFEGTNSDFLRKATDINVPCFYEHLDYSNSFCLIERKR